MKKGKPRFLALLALIVTIGVPRVNVQSQPAAGREQVVIAIPVDHAPKVINPLLRTLASHGVLARMFVTDVVRDSSWKPLPLGVEHLPDVKNATWKLDGERMILIWKLKPRNWHDGTPVTCADYVFSHAVARDKRVGAIGDGNQQVLTNRIASVSCPQGLDGLEIVVRWSQRYGYANQMVVPYGALPRHIIEPFYRANPSRLKDGPFGIDPKVTIGDGPYRLVEWRRSVSVTVESVGDHPIFGTPKIRRIIWKVFDPKTAVVNLLSGAIDAADIGFLAALELERQAGARVKVVWRPGVIWEHIDFNLDNPLLQDLRVRRALAHGINLVQISQQLFGARQPVTHTYLPPRHPGYTEAVEKYPYDPAKARRLLQEAGFAPGRMG